MAQTDTMKALLKRLEDGTAAIRARYESLANASDAQYRTKIAELETDYRGAVNAASAQAQINLKNNLEKMADAGYVRSGETVQATIASGADRAKMLSALSIQKAKDKRGYESEMASARASLALTGEKEAADYENKVSEMILAQQNADREYEAEQRQRAFDNRIKQQSLTSSVRESEKKSEEGIVPEKSPYEYVQEIVKQNSTYHKKKGYTVVDRRAILLAISAVVKDTRLSYRYRYEMYLYGKSLGYIK
ncbi:MAG: hypothetical protein E7580_00215 [Ruminococcaceae bacterium]|nr:hypothetical protein [Oscillospiraceae bacterium]